MPLVLPRGVATEGISVYMHLYAQSDSMVHGKIAAIYSACISFFFISVLHFMSL